MHTILHELLTLSNLYRMYLYLLYLYILWQAFRFIDSQAAYLDPHVRRSRVTLPLTLDVLA